MFAHPTNSDRSMVGIALTSHGKRKLRSAGRLLRALPVSTWHALVFRDLRLAAFGLS